MRRHTSQEEAVEEKQPEEATPEHSAIHTKYFLHYCVVVVVQHTQQTGNGANGSVRASHTHIYMHMHTHSHNDNTFKLHTLTGSHSITQQTVPCISLPDTGIILLYDHDVILTHT